MSIVTGSFQTHRPYESIAFSVALVQPRPAGMRTLLTTELDAVTGAGFWRTVSKLMLVGGAALVGAGSLAAGVFIMIGGLVVDDWCQEAFS